MAAPKLYIFIDESGNFDFSQSGTKYFVFSAVSIIRPFPTALATSLFDLKYSLWESGLEFEYFHATEDRQATRDAVFAIICNHIDSFQCDALVVEKRKAHPNLQSDKGRFYSKFLDILLGYVLEGARRGTFGEVAVVVDAMPIQSYRRAVEKGIKLRLANHASKHAARYKLTWAASKSDFLLQITDYINWAIYRKWEKADLRSYSLVQGCIKTEFDVFRRGTTYFY